MKHLQAVTTLFILIRLVVPEPARADLSPLDQVSEVTRWFTGVFDNAEQVRQNPSVPLVPLSTCPVQLEGASEPSSTQNLYLAQPTINRVAFYSFQPSNSVVNLGVRSFINAGSVSSICDRPLPERIVKLDNLAAAICNLELIRGEERYTATNAPTGCPTSTGGKVVSSVTFQPDRTVSLDQIYNSRGQLIVNTPIEYQRVEKVPEPATIAGTLLAFSFAWWQRKRKQSNRAIVGSPSTDCSKTPTLRC